MSSRNRTSPPPPTGEAGSVTRSGNGYFSSEASSSAAGAASAVSPASAGQPLGRVGLSRGRRRAGNVALRDGLVLEDRLLLGDGLSD